MKHVHTICYCCCIIKRNTTDWEYLCYAASVIVHEIFYNIIYIETESSCHCQKILYTHIQLLLSTSTDWRKEFQFPAVVRMKPQWDPFVKGPQIRGLTTLFQWLFRNCLVPLGSQVVRWRWKLIAAFIRGVKCSYHQTGCSSKILPNILQAQVTSLPPNPPYVAWLRSQGRKHIQSLCIRNAVNLLLEDDKLWWCEPTLYEPTPKHINKRMYIYKTVNAVKGELWNPSIISKEALVQV